ncbi:MAG: hypothetical protein Q8P18_18375 [Pseudomonadota bacterium]|nr:hypothetical protein [Pseudomonadota bacterium]
MSTSLIPVPAELSRKVKALMALAAPVQAAAIERLLDPVYARAKANWPVRKVGSKDSKGKLALEYTVKGGTFKAVLTNRAPYAWYIHGNRTAQGLILTPAREAAKKIGAEIAEEFARRAERVR